MIEKVQFLCPKIKIPLDKMGLKKKIIYRKLLAMTGKRLKTKRVGRKRISLMGKYNLFLWLDNFVSHLDLYFQTLFFLFLILIYSFPLHYFAVFIFWQLYFIA